MVFNDLFLDEKINRPEKFLKVVISVYEKFGVNKYRKIKDGRSNEDNQKWEEFIFSKFHYSKFTTI